MSVNVGGKSYELDCEVIATADARQQSDCLSVSTIEKTNPLCNDRPIRPPTGRWDRGRPCRELGAASPDCVGSGAAGRHVEDTLVPLLTDACLEADDLLALYLSGSFTEWYESFKNPAWNRAIDNLSDQVRCTSVPILAVCGSHQLIGRCFGGWEAIGHCPRGRSRQ